MRPRDKRVAFYCGTGWRASETWFYAYLMDWPRIAVYDGGWFEWSKDPANNPIEVGEPAVVAGPSADEGAAWLNVAWINARRRPRSPPA